MTDQKPLTFMEAMQAAAKGAIVMCKTGTSADSYEYTFRQGVLLCSAIQAIRQSVSEPHYWGARELSIPMVEGEWYIEKPAPTPKMALYAYKISSGRVTTSDIFLKDDDDFRNAFPGAKWFKRLDWSEMEVEE